MKKAVIEKRRLRAHRVEERDEHGGEKVMEILCGMEFPLLIS